MRDKIIALVSNNIATDQRLLKIGKTLDSNGYHFTLIGAKHRGAPSLDHIPFKTQRVPILFQKNIWFYCELQIRLLWRLIKEPKENSILLANDLDTLLPAYIISKAYAIPLVFDSHEIFSELPSLKKGSIQKRVWKFLERSLIPKVDKMYTVSRSYANFFYEQYKVQSKVISNFPVANLDSDQIHTSYELESTIPFSQKKVIIYQGAINYSRGIDKMILAMQYLEEVELWIIGDGPLRTTYEQLVKGKELQDKIKFYGNLLPNELQKITPLADLGLSLEEDNGLSYRYALPNKVFDYIHANIPVLGSSDLSEVKGIIEEYKIGEVTTTHQPQHIAEKIQNLLSHDKNVFNSGLDAARKDLNWQNQEADLISIFSDFN